MVSVSVNKILKILSCIALIAALLVSSFSSQILSNNTSDKNIKSANAAGPNTGDLIIGKVETATTIEISVCVKATPGPLHLNNVSVWFGFDKTALTPSPTILEKGQYGNSTNGYGLLGWQPVSPLPAGNINQWSMRLNFNNNGDPAIVGLPMATTAPELFGRVKFDKIANSTAPLDITLDRNSFFTTEYGTTPIDQRVINVNGLCVNSQCPSNTTSANGYNTPNACTSTCSSGNYLDTSTSTCKICPAGFSCSVGTTIPVQCTTNKYCPEGTVIPNSCPANTSSLAGSTSLAACTSTCPSTNYLDITTYTCKICPAGFFCTLGTTTPTQCKANTYCEAGSIIETNCPSGSLSPAGSISSAACSVQIINLNVTAILAGAYNSTTNLMTTFLNSRNLISSSQPFSIAPYNYAGTEKLPTTNKATNITDWVLIEIKNGTTDAIVFRKAAILLSSGSIIDVDNATVGNVNTGINIFGITSTGNYKVTIRHRNHLGISTDTPIALTPGTVSSLDLTRDVNVKGTLTQEQVGTKSGSAVFGLRKGDSTGNGETLAEDRNALSTSGEFSGTYSSNDLNLDGDIEATDRTFSQVTPEGFENL